MAWADAGVQRTDGHGLAEIGFRRAKPTDIAIPGFRAVLQHYAVMGNPCIGPVEGAEQGLVAEHHILPAGLHTQTLKSCEVSNQHVRSTDPQCAAVTPAIGCRTAVMVPRIV